MQTIEQQSCAQGEKVPLPKLAPGETFKFGEGTMSEENGCIVYRMGPPMAVRPDGSSRVLDPSNPDHFHQIGQEAEEKPSKGEGNE